MLNLDEFSERNATISKSMLALLGIIIFVAFAIRFYFAVSFPNIHYPDELFQYLEQGHRVAFGNGVIPWEYREGTRSWVLPGFIAGLMALSDLFYPSGPDFYIPFIQAVFCIISLAVVVVGFLWGYRSQGALAGFITAVLCAVWFELIYFAPKTLTEVVTAHILVVAVYLAYPTQPTSDRRRLFIAGLLFGLVVVLRMHLAPAVLVAAIYICRLDVVEKWLPIVVGGLIVFILAGMVDAFTWSYPFSSFVANFWVNIGEQKSHNWGVDPWYYYAGKWVQIWGGAFVPIAFLALVATRKNLLLALVAVSVVLTHTAFAHKEFRFVFPAVPFIVILVGLGTAQVFDYIRRDLKSRNLTGLAFAGVVVAWIITSVTLGIGGYFKTNWYSEAEGIKSLKLIGQRTDACAVGFVGTFWPFTGGYTYLHKDIPIIIPEDDSDGAISAYNYAYADSGNLPQVWPYEEVHCWTPRIDATQWTGGSASRLCVYRREGSCEAKADLEINEVLRRQGH